MEHADILSPGEMRGLLEGDAPPDGGGDDGSGPDKKTALDADGEALLRELVQLALTGAFHSGAGAPAPWKARWIDVAPPQRLAPEHVPLSEHSRGVRLSEDLEGFLAISVREGNGSPAPPIARLAPFLSEDLPARLGRLLGVRVHSNPFGLAAWPPEEAKEPWLSFASILEGADGTQVILDLSFSDALARALLRHLTGQGETEEAATSPESPPEDAPRPFPDPGRAPVSRKRRASPVREGSPSVKRFRFPPFEGEDYDLGELAEEEGIGLEELGDLPVRLTVELGRAKVELQEIMEWAPGSVVELDRLAGEMVDVLVNGKPIAKGEVVVVEDAFSVKITDIVTPLARLSGLA